MGISYLLDHTKPTSTFVGTDKIDTIKELVSLGGLLGYNLEKRNRLETEITTFLREKLGWSDEDQSIYYKSSPVDWRKWDGLDKYPLLSRITIRIYTIPTSSAASERSWSIFKFVHSSRRNRLSNDKVIKLAFIYSNHGPKDAIAPVIYDPIVDLVRAPGDTPNSASATSRPDTRASDEMLRSILEIERLFEGTTTPQQDEDWSDGAHWGDEDHLPSEVVTNWTF
eukprot:jgi/Phyca11/105486/e_gw1.11.336.1